MGMLGCSARTRPKTKADISLEIAQEEGVIQAEKTEIRKAIARVKVGREEIRRLEQKRAQAFD